MSCDLHINLLMIVEVWNNAVVVGVLISFVTWKLMGIRHRCLVRYLSATIIGATPVAKYYIASCFSMISMNVEAGYYGVMGENVPIGTAITYFCVSIISFRWCDEMIRCVLLKKTGNCNIR